MTCFSHPHVVFFGNESNHSHQQEQFFPLVYFISIFGTPGKKRFFWGFRTQKFRVLRGWSLLMNIGNLLRELVIRGALLTGPVNMLSLIHI